MLLSLTHTNIHYRFDAAHSTFFYIQENTHDHNCCSQYKELLSCCLLIKLLVKKHCDFLFRKKITWTVTPCILNNFFNNTHTHYILLYAINKIKWLQHSLNNSRHNSFLMHTNIHYRFGTAPSTAFHVQDNPVIWHAHNQCAIAAVNTAKKFCLTGYH